jgi:hypothetical protein
VEALYEDEGFKDRQLAALVASKVRSAAEGGPGARRRQQRQRQQGGVTAAAGHAHCAGLVVAQQQRRQCGPSPIPPQVFYHLGELDSALTYALGAGPLFDVNEDSEYVRTLVGE